LPYTKLEPATTRVLAHSFLMGLEEKHDISGVPRNLRFPVCERDAERLVNAAFFVDGSRSSQDACRRHGFDSDTKNTRIGMLSNMSLEI